MVMSISSEACHSALDRGLGKELSRYVTKVAYIHVTSFVDPKFTEIVLNEWERH